MFDPRSPFHRRMWHYESDRPLSVAQLISLGSLDAATAALLWLLIEHHQSLIVSGPTDPTPGVGKTTTLNALLDFLPAGSTLVYTTGMYEDFEFLDVVEPASTCVLANEVSDHLPIYMWGRTARKLLSLPQQGFAIATSCHADTITDVLSMLTRDLRLADADVSRLGVIVNIGLVGHVWPPRRRFLTVNYAQPATLSGQAPTNDAASVRMLPLATWDEATDTFLSAVPDALREVADALSIPHDDFLLALQRRTERMEALAQGRGVGTHTMREAVEKLMADERTGNPAS